MLASIRPSYRIGSTSYVHAGGLIHNLRRLAGEVEDVELILFEDKNGAGNLPSPAEVREIAGILADARMSVSVHLPCDVGGVVGAVELKRASELNRRVLELTGALAPVAYIFHASTEGNGTEEWYGGVLEGIEAMARSVGDRRQLALENLESYAPEALEPIIVATKISRALDIGHLWKQRRDPLPVIERWLPDTSVVHLHGVGEEAGRMVDHCSLAYMDTEDAAWRLDAVLKALEGWRGVVTLEVFEGDYFASREALERALERLHGGGWRLTPSPSPEVEGRRAPHPCPLQPGEGGRHAD